ncbi:hypothetical protein [Virgibacillus saliphilus]|uniref:hypothetical protein n=1 Tax=Virgibacillus saliphilus TaxID=2831674 RepID=UPI0021076F60|nr:hypothetical protein [Virgibacillus sp. NKC19-3]
MSSEDRKSAMDDFKRPSSIFTMGFLTAGAFLATLGNALAVHIINIVGIVLLGIGGIVSFLHTWRKNKLKSIYILLLFLLSIFLLS